MNLNDTHHKCINSWSKYFPAENIKCIDDAFYNKLDALGHIPPVIKKYYKSKTWAFVSDYLRIYVLLRFGGMYLDTDVELFKNPIETMKEDLEKGLPIIGFETKKTTGTCFLYSPKDSKLFQLYKDYYDKLSYNDTLIANTQILRKIINSEYSFSCLKTGKAKQYDFPDFICYDPRFYYPVNCYNVIHPGYKDAIGVHYFEISWLSTRNQTSLRKKLKDSLEKVVCDLI